MKNGELCTTCIECGLYFMLCGVNTVCVCKLMSNSRYELLDCEYSCIALFIVRGLERIALRHLFLGRLVHAEPKAE